MRHLISAYIYVTSHVEVLSAWLLTVSAHGDHLGHPFV